MKRLPKGPPRKNYTLYLSGEEIEQIKNRAKELDMAESYLILKLIELDSQLGVMEHVEAGGHLVLMGVDEGVPGGDFSVRTNMRVEDGKTIIETGPPDEGVEVPSIAERSKPPEDYAEQMEAAEDEFTKNIQSFKRKAEIALPEETVAEPVKQKYVPSARQRGAGQKPSMQEVRARQGIHRPQMKTRQQLLREQDDLAGPLGLTGQTTTIPGTQEFSPALQKEVVSGEQGESTMRKEILENLPEETE